MSAPTVRDVDYLLVINRARWIGAKARGVVEEIAAYAKRLDQLLDQCLAAMGYGACACGKPKSTFGTGVALCPSCDFRSCQECGHTVYSLTLIACPTCKAVPAT